jgi:hypothetical protein
MSIHEASRTLLKSQPELWAECSVPSSLMRHLDKFGEIKITRLVPETAVAWEGETVSGTVRFEPSGWGTRVILTAEEVEPADPAPSEPAAADSPSREPTPGYTPQAQAQPELDSPEIKQTEVRLGFFARFRSKWRRSAELASMWPQVDGVHRADAATVASTTDVPVPVEPAPLDPAAAAALSNGTGPAPLPAPPEAEADPSRAPETRDTVAALKDALESLGTAHHRPFSRA